MSEEPPIPDQPETPPQPPQEPPLADVVRRALLTIADLRDATEKLERRRTSRKLPPPDAPPEAIP